MHVIGSLVPLSTLTAKIEVGLAVCLESNKITIMDAAAADDTKFVGISMSAVAKAGDITPVSVARVCIVDTTLVSGTYTLGAGLKWSADYTYTADGNADTIGWIHDNSASARTQGLMFIDVMRLGIAADKLYDAVSA